MCDIINLYSTYSFYEHHSSIPPYNKTCYTQICQCYLIKVSITIYNPTITQIFNIVKQTISYYQNI